MGEYSRRYQNARAARWRAENRERYNAYHLELYHADPTYWRERYQASKHPCADCGVLVGPKSVRCVRCANRRRRNA